MTTWKARSGLDSGCSPVFPGWRLCTKEATPTDGHPGLTALRGCRGDTNRKMFQAMSQNLGTTTVPTLHRLAMTLRWVECGAPPPKKSIDVL